MTKNAIGSIFFLAFSSFYFFNVFSIKKMPGSQFEVMTASTFPFYLGLGGIIISSLILVLSFVKKDNDFLTLEYLRKLDFKTTFYFVLAMLFYGFTIRTLGFIIATIIFLTIGFLLLKEKNIKRILLISSGVSIGFYLLLNNVLGVYIDPGMVYEYFVGVES
ncbi:tripartite tricarboxylate transporter TctB family protein [Poseidonibacter ostreae]|jgi:putative tricarboxylic transport membrane protein|uniref:Tripartite tricarboxylate transporter TctB family protein n=1 Tax=Poseidonibacter ostreae TaxID=2654171 RepID=A0A6L4WPM1_9BACT|nr:tripartite tricarboxylate transporter TctB family protein [Poseidonibacter ostreae]KAB7884225.1 tripartite tricarboxylate transporter TctB family protein [Poseidonibacter ostreae]KAB7886092.1 tripartite tricarboxylate transporter TctB family protein [Poseidonibacter ostreae]KAB7889822.1 tripartite tricarboxylate transporter TctB family protein [Poseidonibacter ostreae]MAC83918.1 tricarboxylate transporter [Arcobacter sp.]